MACDKVYGLRKVYIAEIDGSFYELKVQSIEVPKVFAEVQEIDESSGVRGATASVKGNIGELTGTITITLPASSTNFYSNTALMTLLKAGNFAVSGSSAAPVNAGCTSGCTIVTIDRTGLLMERMENVIVTNISITCDRSNAPTMQLSYQAASKVEVWGSRGTSAFNNTSAEVTTADIIVNTGLGTGEWNNDQLELSIGGSETAYVSGVSGTSCTVTRYEPETHSGSQAVLPTITATAASSYAYASNRSWDFLPITGGDPLKIQSCSLEIETGLSYGELIRGEDFVSEILVGGFKATGKVTVYYDHGAASQAAYNGLYASGHTLTIGGVKLSIANMIVTDTPDLSLSKNEPASGDFTFECYNTNGLNSVTFGT